MTTSVVLVERIKATINEIVEQIHKIIEQDTTPVGFYETLIQKFQEVVVDIASLGEQLQQSENASTVEAVYEAHLQELDQIKSVCELLRKENHALTEAQYNHNTSKQEKDTTISELEQKLAETKALLQKSKKENEILESQKNDMQQQNKDQIDKLKKDLEHNKTSLSIAENKHAELEKIIEGLHEVNSQYESIIGNSNTDLEALRTENAELIQALEDLQASQDKSEKEKKDLESKIEHMVIKIESLTQELNWKETRLAAANDELDVLRIGNQKLESDKRAANHSTIELRADDPQQQAELQQLADAKNEILKLNKDLEQTKQKLTDIENTEKESLLLILEEQSERIKKLEDELKVISEKDDLIDGLSQSLRETSAKVTAEKKKAEELEKEMQQLMAVKNTSLDMRLLGQEKTIALQKKQIEKLTTSLNQATQQLEEIRHDKELKFKKGQDDTNATALQKQQEDLIANLHQQLQEARTQAEKEKEQVAHLTQEVQKLMQKANSSAELRELREKEALKKELQTAQECEQDKIQKLTELNATLKNKEEQSLAAKTALEQYFNADKTELEQTIAGLSDNSGSRAIIIACSMAINFALIAAAAAKIIDMSNSLHVKRMLLTAGLATTAMFYQISKIISGRNEKINTLTLFKTNRENAAEKLQQELFTPSAPVQSQAPSRNNNPE